MVWNFVATTFLPNYEWSKTSTGKIKESCYDISDSMIIAKYAAEYLDNKTAPVRPKPVKKKKMKTKASTSEETEENTTEELVQSEAIEQSPKKKKKSKKPKVDAEPDAET
mmetsp:Transcript_1241/g.1680  ORF Transcript_1241/g.1680 Transcript_1241/m.1680 type:complete len:110 (-) Transcript_1241:163-492(-)